MVNLIAIQFLISGQQTGVTNLDSAVADAMRSVPRHAFVPEPLQRFAYRDHPLPVGHDQNISSPFLVALMTQLAELEPGSVVFETGTGAGYHAAVLSGLVEKVYSVEVVAPLAQEAERRLKDLGYDNVRVKHGDGYYGWADHAPYDAIIVKEALDHVPAPLMRQLRPGGHLVIPLGDLNGGQILTVIRKGAEGRITRKPVLPVVFSPLQGGERT
ncbi:MAG: protein-L-isoaspartate(D-aspartate) O-methyltransferase [Kiloniellales bacterium]|nr:protein-L-isoaspartate(D-aspartate) O-methyltransferase [Kiloniellales bacterium]